MQENAEISDAAIFNDASETIRKAIAKVVPQSPDRLHFSREAFRIALQQLL